MELESQRAKLEARGLKVAAVSYDSVEILREFARRKGIGFPLLSDADSAVIRRFGLLNTAIAESDPLFGIPLPTTFVTNAAGRVVSRFAEEGYVARRTAASYLALAGDTPERAVSTVETPLLSLRTSASNVEVVLGSHLTLVLDFALGAGLHAYAPGNEEYRPLALRLEPSPYAQVHLPVYPPSRPFHFAPLDETVEVFEGRFRLTQDVTLEVEDRALLTTLLERENGRLRLAGVVSYQLCTATLCHPPAELPVAWELEVRPLDRERSPEAIRHSLKPKG